MDQCHIPVSAHFVVDDGEIICSDYTYSYISASELADFLFAKFSIDAELMGQAEEKQIA